jgi:hypothetical protein
MGNKLNLFYLLILLTGLNIQAQNIRVRGVGVSIRNVNLLEAGKNQLIYPLGMSIGWEEFVNYSTLGKRHFWVTRPAPIVDKDYATTARPETLGREGCQLNQIISDAATTIRIALPIDNMKETGWTLTKDVIDTSITKLFIYTFNYTNPNTWIDVPYFDIDKPTIVFADRGKLKLDNPLPVSSIGAEAIVIYDAKDEWNRVSTAVDPNIIILPNGDYIAGMGGKRFVSKDKGKTWKQLSNYGVGHASTFYHKGALYIIGDSFKDAEKSALITKSTDGGATWSTVVRLGFNSRNSPSQVEVSRGRIWFAHESYDTHVVNIASAPEDSDLMGPSSWTVTKRTDNYVWDSKDADLEPCMVVGSDGWPIALPESGPPIRASSATSTTPMFAKNLFVLPGSNGKFDAKFDPKTGKYWALTSHSPIKDNIRTGIALFSSTDLKTWKKEKQVIQGSSPSFHGFNYPFLQFEGDDMIFVLRTAWENEYGQPQRWHDANMFTFHRIKNFRGTTPFSPNTMSVTVNGSGFQTRNFANGSALFLNRAHQLENIPAAFAGFEFAASDGGVVNDGAITPSQNGFLYIIAPTAGVSGWDLVPNTTFNYSDTDKTSISIFQKAAIANKPIAIPTVTSFPGVSPIAKKVVNQTLSVDNVYFSGSKAEKNKVYIKPNPVVDTTFTIATNGFSVTQIMIVDLAGKVIFEKILENNTSLEYNISKPRENGVYVIKVKDINGYVYNAKLIVQ